MLAWFRRDTVAKRLTKDLDDAIHDHLTAMAMLEYYKSRAEALSDTIKRLEKLNRIYNPALPDNLPGR